MKISIYRFNPEIDQPPHMQDFELDDDSLDRDSMLLDALLCPIESFS